ncbi:MAG: LPS export ABC transporter periplasmic protein LptC [Variibacter sp.]|nr:LPS export ABC transporter periplasmic protein LptC [Variibacter sp.]
MRTTVITDSARHVWRASDRDDLAPAFRRARRHSRLVRLLRVAIPAGIATAVALHVLASWVVGSGVNLPALSNLVVSGSKIRMDRPHVAGYTRDGRAYELDAHSAAQDLKKPQIVELTAVRAKMQLADGGTVVITADMGIYDSKNEVVSLRQNVVCTATDGTEIRLSEATMDVRKGHILSQKPVEVLQQNARIAANEMEVVDNGAVVHFRGGVRFISSAAGLAPARKPQEATQ